MKGIRLGKDGISMTEIIVTVAIIGTISTLLYTVLYGNWLAYNREILAADLQLESRTAIDRIVRDIRVAEAVVLSGTNDLTLTIGGEDVVYQINTDDQLTRTVGEQARVLCEHVDQESSGFWWSGARSIDIDIRLVQSEAIFTKGQPRNVIMRLQSSAQRRNF